MSAAMAVVVMVTAAVSTHSAPKVSLDPTEVRCMAEVVYFEARGQSTAGQMGVASVVLHRMQSDKYHDTACGVAKAKKQFSPNISKAQIKDLDAWFSSVQIAAHTLAGHLTDPVPGAMYFQNFKDATWWPSRYDVQERGRIGGHIFYADR